MEKRTYIGRASTYAEQVKAHMAGVARWVFCAVLVLGVSAILGAQAEGADNGQPAGNDAQGTGQSVTQLPDGTRLLLGGFTKEGLATNHAALLDSKQHGHMLANGLHTSRAGQSATVVPDGSVVVIGGIGASGQPVANLERYQPTTHEFEDLGNIGLPALTGQSATLLTNGTLLIAGGKDVSSLVRSDMELLDPATMIFSSGGSLALARTGQQAELLPNGDVLIWGGLDQAGRPVRAAELYDPGTKNSTIVDQVTFARLLSEEDKGTAPSVTATIPQAGSVTAVVDARLAVRFSKPLNPTSVSNQTVTLYGPAGTVAIAVVAAEGGRLAFITPNQDLFPGSSYTLFIKGAKDAYGQTVPFTAISFRTAVLAPSVSGPPLVLQTSRAPPTVVHADDGIWTPSPENLTGNWRSGQAHLARQHMPLRGSVARAIYGVKIENGLPDAPSGVTAVAGQVLQLNGQPLASVTLTIGSRSVETDRNGEFLLSGVPSGTQVLVIDGATASRGAYQYGRYEYRAILGAGKTNDLPFIIWMTRLDTHNAVVLPSPTTTETLVTSPNIPGLELKIHPGTIIRDSNGGIVTRVSMTAIPVDQPPFPLPNRQVPVYFTIQPGGAHLQSLNAKASQGAQLIYPNFQKSPPGTRIDFWNYDATAKGWYVYGQGTVSSDGKQIIPDPGVAIYEFSGAMVALPGDAPAVGPPPGGDGCKSGANAPASAGDPVDCFTGLYVQTRTDLAVSDVIPLQLQRVYRQQDSASRAFGIGTNLSYDLYMVGDTNPWTYQDLVLADGSRVHFQRTSEGTSYADAIYQTQSPGPYFGSIIRWVGGNPNTDAWELTEPNGTVYQFADEEGSADARCAAATGMRDRYHNTLTFVRDDACDLTAIMSPNGRSITFTYDASDRITQAMDNSGRTVSYQYDAGGRLTAVTDPIGNTESYTYDSSNNLLTVTDRRSNLVLTNTYDSNDRVSKQTYADGSFSTFSYTLDGNGAATGMTYTDPKGSVKDIEFNTAGYPTAVTLASGTSYQERTTYVRDPNTNLATSITDALGRVTAYQYNSDGNVTQVTYLAGTGGATTWIYTYDPAYDELASITDPEGHTSTFSHDALGNLTSVANALGDETDFAYNAAGQIISSTRQVAGNDLTTQIGYFSGAVASVTDPLGRTTNYVRDALGRMTAIVDPLGNIRRIIYDSLDRVTQTTDPMGNSLKYGYDADGNLTSFTDARSSITSFTYDSTNRISSMTDPLDQTETYSYDSNGNVIEVVDRNGRVSGFTYDLLNRELSAGYGGTTSDPTAYVSTIGYTWDAGDRRTQAVDSSAGTIVDTFNGLDKLIEEQSPQGQISYTYYPNGLRETMTVQGQPSVGYSYDNADRLTQISQGTEVVGISYDTANRRESVTLPNGVQVQYAYDNASEITGITYQHGGTSLGNITYTYDADGRRIGEGGSFAQVSAAAPVTVASYDAANRLTSWGGVTLSYDSNGNLTNSGASTYSWNERNQLVGASDGNASYAYDAFGRRISKTVSGATTTYVNDGKNPALVNDAFMLAGFGLDEYYAQVSSAGTTGLLSDAIGSILAETDGAGAVTAGYSYAPYGVASQSGTGVTPFQFSGREIDGATGLYFLRARYYAPALGRFISQDPMGLIGGPNLYAYADDDPVANVDPLGLYCLSPYAIGAISGAAGGAVAGALTGAVEGAAAGGVGAIPGAIAGFFGGGALGAAGGAAVAGTTGQAGYAGALGGGPSASGIVAGIYTGVLSHGLSQGTSLSPAAANGLAGAGGGAIQAGLAEAAMGPAAAAGAIGGLISGLVQSALEKGNDCACGK